VLAALAAGPARADTPSYAKQVKPFFARYCLECHGGRDPEGGLNLETFKGLADGGDHGAVFTAGKPDASRMVRMVEGKTGPRMPPKKARQPKAEEVALLRAWIDSGAKDDSATSRVTLPDVQPKTPVLAPVTALAYHPAGKLLAAAGRGEVLFFETATGELWGQLGGQNDKVTALAFTPDGKRLAVASSAAGGPHEVRLYDFDAAAAPGARNAAVVNKHDDVIYGLAFSPDGRLLASCGYDRVIRVWDVRSAQRTELHLLKDHSDAVYGVAFSPDGKLLASGSADRAVKVWDVASGRRLHTLGEPTDWVYAVAWSPDGRHLAAAGVDRSVRVWDVTPDAVRLDRSAFAHQGAVTRLAYAADGKTLYSLGEDRVAKAWDAARLVERRVYAAQPEAPLALAVRPDGAQLAVGRYDGVLVLLAEATGKVRAEPLPIKPKPPVLSKLTPSAGTRGREVTVKLEGKHLRGATALTSTLPGLKAVLSPGSSGDALEARLTIPATAPAGHYPLRVTTPAGESGPVSFTVDLFSAVAEVEPNDSPRTGQAVTLPATLVGSIGRAGDVDYYRFEAKAGQEVGVQTLAASAGAKLDPVLVLTDGEGQVLVESTNGLLGFTCPRAGTYALGVRDRDYRGGPMHYRLQVGDVPVVNGVFPLGLQRGTETELRVDGVHLGAARTVRVKAPADAAVGSRLPVPVPALGAPSVVVGEFPEAAARDRRGTLPVPGTGNGAITEPGATDAWRFSARKGQRLLIEVEARRIGSPLDSFIEILDAGGRPLPRATLRCVSKTYVAFRDHDSGTPGIRLETWNDLAMDDYLLVGEELVRIWELPKNPDDDCQFYRAGGQRLAFLGTTPTFHSMGMPMYKVALHPPGATFPPNGLPVVTLHYRNDDGGPGFGKDSRLVFDAPADGDYQVRVGDARGQAGPRHAYRLTVRPPRPSFNVSFNPTAPAVSKGGAVPLRVSANRIDEFAGPIEVRLENLPPGLHAPATTIPAGENSTSFALYAEPTAAVPPKAAPLKLVARAVIDGKELVREVTGGLPKLTEPGEIVTTTEQSEVTVRPGGEVRVTVHVERRNGFKGRIPVEVQGLPHGVHVLDIGLNGILVTENETRRTFVIRAEPWVAPTAHPFVVLAKREGKNTEHAARSVLLRVADK
jgi:WD40 repeat protein